MLQIENDLEDILATPKTNNVYNGRSMKMKKYIPVINTPMKKANVNFLEEIQKLNFKY